MAISKSLLALFVPNLDEMDNAACGIDRLTDLDAEYGPQISDAGRNNDWKRDLLKTDL